MARRRRKHRYDALAAGLMVVVAAPVLIAAASLYVVVADAKHPRWWIVILLVVVGASALLLGLALYVGPRLWKDRLSIEVAPGAISVVAQLPDDHPRKGANEGAVLLHGIRFTSLEDQDVSLGVELLAERPGQDFPVRLFPEPHRDDLQTPINLTPSQPSLAGDLSFQWSSELMENLAGRGAGEVFSLKLIDYLSKREAIVQLGGVSITDEV